MTAKAITYPWTKGTKIWDSHGRRFGLATGSIRQCKLEGCTGLRVYIKWPEGHMTMPCSKRLLEQADGSYRIG